MKTQQKIILTTALLSCGLLASCGKKPEAAAQEVCACIQKTAGSQNLGAMAGNSAECQELAANYREKYSGEELNTFVRATTECATAGLRP